MSFRPQRAFAGTWQFPADIYEPPSEPPPEPVVTSPDPVSSLTLRGGDGYADVEWTDPSSDGGSPVTGWMVTFEPVPVPTSPPPPASPPPPTSPPVPPPPSLSVYRAFKAESFWNQPLPAGAPIDRDNAVWLANVKANAVEGSSTPPIPVEGMRLTMGDFAQPFYWATSADPVRTVTDSNGRSVTMRIPEEATPMAGNDAEFTVFDLGSDVCAGFWHSSRDAAGNITTEGLDKWRLSSLGYAGKLAQSDTDFNEGHRGSPAPLRGIRVDEVKAGLIPHKVSTFWWATHPSVYFPMSGYESGKGGIVPEGVCLRVKRSVDVAARFPNPYARVIAKAWQDYGLYVGDNSATHCRVKVERSNEWAAMGIDLDTLRYALPWDDWEFIDRDWPASVTP